MKLFFCPECADVVRLRRDTNGFANVGSLGAVIARMGSTLM